MAAVRRVVDDVAALRFDSLESGRHIKLGVRENVRAIIQDYPATFVPLPDEALVSFAVFPLLDSPGVYAVDAPMWTLEEGRSAMEVSVTVGRRDSFVFAWIKKIRVG